MRKIILSIISLFLAVAVYGKQFVVSSPNGKMTVTLSVNNGQMNYAVSLDGKQMIEPSMLGFITNNGDWSKGLSVVNSQETKGSKCYQMRNAKASHINFEANGLTVSVETADKYKYDVEFVVADNDVAFRYFIPQQKGDLRSLVIEKELSSFKFPAHTTTFITPQSLPMVGWMRTKPSYEEVYTNDAPMSERSAFGQGFTFPCLFNEGEDGWVLVAETGVNGTYCGAHLTDWNAERGYSIAFPMEGEMNGLGSAKAGLSLPQPTPWRTITLGKTLQPIVETTISYDVVDEVYKASTDYKNGRYTWSWLIWQDDYITYDVQKQMIDLSAAMGYEYVLVDNWWDEKIGRDKIAELSKYAQSKGV
ncbi:MAG: glycoside hydrolase family 97 N-terminal domain-containing protein, partial [Prevotella sp.]|nr:glycoside hydrolase family 97 N-terminal domain-containing protein [Prevotella sp.]